jgi:hypothetical protein
MAGDVGVLQEGCVTRKRVRLQLTVHPLTDQRLDSLCVRFASNKGRVVDKLVECLHAAYLHNRQYCISGKPCKVDLTDLPDVF